MMRTDRKLMNAKEFLRQYEYAVKRAAKYREMYETEQECIDAIRSTLGSDGMPHGSGVSRKTEDKAIKLAERAQAWKEAELDALDARALVFNVIVEIDGIEGDVLYERYINLLTWEEIADKLTYSLRGVLYAHGRALQIVSDKL